MIFVLLRTACFDPECWYRNSVRTYEYKGCGKWCKYDTFADGEVLDDMRVSAVVCYTPVCDAFLCAGCCPWAVSMAQSVQ